MHTCKVKVYSFQKTPSFSNYTCAQHDLSLMLLKLKRVESQGAAAGIHAEKEYYGCDVYFESLMEKLGEGQKELLCVFVDQEKHMMGRERNCRTA